MGALTIYLSLFLLVFVAVAYRNLRVALYLILASLPLYLIKFKFGPIPTTLLELMIYTATVVWLIQIWQRRVFLNLRAIRFYFWPTLLVFIGLLIGTIVSAEPTVSLGIIKGWFVDPGLLFVMMTSALQRQLHIKKAIVALILPAAILSLFALYQVLTGSFVTVDQRASAVFTSANYLSLYLVPIMVLGIGLFFAVASKWRWWVGISWLLMLSALYFTFSYASWLGLVAGMGVAVLFFFRFGKAALISLGLFIVAVASQLSHPKFQQMLDLSGRSSSHVRLQVWQTALLMIKEHPFTGIGLGLFERRYLEFAQRLFHPPLELRTLHAHNIVLQFLINTGLIGTVGFIWWIVQFVRQAGGLFLRERSPLAVATIASMGALIVHGMFDLAYWKNDLAVLFWVLLAFGIILDPKFDSAYAGR